ncbi:hypothetical protein [Sorangium sp. So ce590]|uniref:hypothetical protein n=1 Tax=unclassified Sorangium TaxID=2621164 RepID=UPI003F5E96CA
MRLLHRCFHLALPTAAAALSAAAGCDFPDATFTDDTSAASAGGAGAGATTSSASTAASSSDAAGSGGGAATSGAGGDGGGAAASGSGGAGGAGGDGAGGNGAGGDGAGGDAATSSASASSAVSGSGGGAASSSSSSAVSGSGGGGSVDCDADDDGYRSTACEGGNDCNDNNPSVHPGQPSTFYETPIRPGGGFDYDCSGAEERELPVVNCSGLVCAATTNVFLTNVACGARGPFGGCNALCQTTIIYPDSVRACH